jgi:hypothetical protein
MPKSKAQKTVEFRSLLPAGVRKNLYETACLLDLETRQRIGLTVPCLIYVQDPSTAKEHEELGLQEIHLRWEPTLGDGPTSSRLAVVDYDGDTGVLQPPARWCLKTFSFLTDGDKAVNEAKESRQFFQVNAWATVQRVLEYYEDPFLLGRPIPWAFEGNRLMIVPQAGFRENAFYDRKSKSLQLYYFGDAQKPCYNCLSHDVVSHETGHALLDGIRPYFLENSSWETAAFHEFLGDITAILLSLRNNDVRDYLEKKFGVELKDAPFLAGVAEEFGTYVNNRPFLRTGLNTMTFAEAQQDRSAHECSQVLTGAMFDILMDVARQYLSPERQAERKEAATPADALWWAAERMGRLALQPLDLLPPVDVRFLDYARAVLRVDELNDPEDPHDYRKLIRQVFHKRGLCPHPFETCEADPKNCALSLEDAPRLDVFHDLAQASRSRTAAYQLVNDNRKRLGIPYGQDFVIADVYDCNKLDYTARRLPRHVVIEYVWREDVKLDEPRFGRLRGETVHLLCGGTLLFDDRGNLLWWTAKRGRGTEEGERRRAELLDHIAQVVASRRLTLADEPVDGGLTGHTGAVVAHRVDGALRLETAPHLCGDAEEREDEWTTSF